jgi:hypothetical protein
MLADTASNQNVLFIIAAVLFAVAAVLRLQARAFDGALVAVALTLVAVAFAIGP